MSARNASGSAEDPDARIAALEARLDVMQAEANRARMVLDSAVDCAIITLDPLGCTTGWNSGAAGITGYSAADMLGRRGEVLFTAEDRADGAFSRELYTAAERGMATNERWHLKRDGDRFWASGSMLPLLDEAGRLHGFVNIFRDRTAAQTDAKLRELLVEELNHRIKNTYALVQAVAAQTARHASAPGSFLLVFGQRLAALAAANDLLFRAGTGDVPLRGVVEGLLAAYRGEASRVDISGNPATVRADLVPRLSLVLHELTTNAVKHGALSVVAGRLSVDWMVQPDGGIDLLWLERGGPPVRPPTHAGFGTQLLRRGLSRDIKVQLNYEPDGLECRITLPMIGAAWPGSH